MKVMPKLSLRTKEDVRLAIKRRGVQIAAEMTDKEFFESPEFYNYTVKLADYILRNHRLYSLKCKYDESDPDIGYTDGKSIFINCASEMAKHPKLLERRFKVNMGVLFHEVAHKLFLNFNRLKKAIETVEGGSFYGKFPELHTPELEKAKEEMEKAIAANPKAMASVQHLLENILSDGHDERAMKNCFPGFIAECIQTAGEEQMAVNPSLSEAIDQMFSDNAVYNNLILSYAKWGVYNIGVPSEATDKYMRKMQEVEPIIAQAVEEDNFDARWTAVNGLTLFLWPVIRDIFAKKPQQGQGGQQSGSAGTGASSGQCAQSGSSGGQSGQQNSSPSGSGGFEVASDEEVQKALDTIAKQSSQLSGAAPAPKNCTGSGSSQKEVKAKNGKDNAPAPTGSFGSVLTNAAENAAASQVQSALDKAQKDAIRNQDTPLIHSGATLTTTRHLSENTDLKTAYEDIYKEIRPYVDSLVKEMENAIREQNEEYVQRHRRYGPIVQATEGYRPQRDFFAKKKLPDDYPHLAVAVVIDESGSMCGEKIDNARKMAVLLERFAASLDIPCMIAGHTASGGRVRLRIYTDFLSAHSEKDRYQLASISPRNCNRDGLAILTVGNLLSQRPEDTKLLIVISDGTPNDHGYGGKEARDDISQIVKKLRRSGVQVFGAAIDEDRDVIEEIYGKGFLSIENLSALPRTMARLVKQKII